jgi:PAS domain S-box-containing protein
LQPARGGIVTGTPPAEPSGAAKADLFELIVESALDFAIYTVDAEGRATSWNIGAERLFGFSGDEILGSSADIVFTPEDRLGRAPEHERRVAQTAGRALDDRWHQRKDGSRFWASGLLMPLKSGEGFVKITRDLTEQRATEEQLRENEERFRVLATNIPQLVFRTRPTGDRTASAGWMRCIQTIVSSRCRRGATLRSRATTTPSTGYGAPPTANIAGIRRAPSPCPIPRAIGSAP